MRIILVGASGKIGREIDAALSGDHDIVRVGATNGDIQCDYTSAVSVKAMFRKAGAFDALVCVAGRDSAFKPFHDLAADDYRYGFERKFLGQVRLLELGQASVRDGGCFVFTSGYLSNYPNPSSIATGPLNAAIDTFVMNTARLLPRKIRLNIVSPAPVVEPGEEGEGLVTAAGAARFYLEAVEGDFTGQVIRAWGGLPVVST